MVILDFICVMWPLKRHGNTRFYRCHMTMSQPISLQFYFRVNISCLNLIFCNLSDNISKNISMTALNHWGSRYSIIELSYFKGFPERRRFFWKRGRSKLFFSIIFNFNLPRKKGGSNIGTLPLNNFCDFAIIKKYLNVQISMTVLLK